MEAKRNVAKTLLSVSRWMRGLGHSEALLAEAGAVSKADSPRELLSCSDLSSEALSAEGSSGSSLDDSAASSANAPLAPTNDPQVTGPIIVAPYIEAYIQQIYGELHLLQQGLPEDVAPGLLCRALGFTLHAKHGWAVKFCCQAKDARLPHTVPRAWAEEVLVVTPFERLQFVVDLRFQDKFLVKCPSPLGEDYLQNAQVLLPDVFVGTVPQLLRYVDIWTARLETVFRDQAWLVPPWRARRSFQHLYKFCMECDATASTECLQRIAQQSAEDPQLKDNTWRLSGTPLAGLRLTLGPMSTPAQPFPSPAVESPSEPIEYNFEKEELPNVSATTDCSGLSFLLNSR